MAHKVVATTPDLTKLNLDDKEYILANGNPEDAQKLWSVLEGQVTPVPGVVTERDFDGDGGASPPSAPGSSANTP